MEFYDSGTLSSLGIPSILVGCEERSVPQTDNEIESFKEKPGVNEVFFFLFLLLEVYLCLFHPSCRIERTEKCKYKCAMYFRHINTHAITHLCMYIFPKNRRCWSVSEVLLSKKPGWLENSQEALIPHSSGKPWATAKK